MRHVRAGRTDAMNWEEKYNAIAELVDGYRRERDEARADVTRLSRLLKMAEDEAVAADDHGRRESRRSDAAEAEAERLGAERDEAQREVARLKAEVASSLAMAKIADAKHDQKCAEVDMLRGVGCMEDGDGPCGVCRKCAYRRGAEAMRARCEEIARHACSVIGKLEHTYGIMTQGHIETVSRLILEADIPEEP